LFFLICRKEWEIKKKEKIPLKNLVDICGIMWVDQGKINPG